MRNDKRDWAMDKAPEDENSLPPHLTYLKRLVTGMAVVMIAGFVVLILTLVIRLNQTTSVAPDKITLPDGVTATAYTVGNGWYAIVTEENHILIYDAATGGLRQDITIE